MGIGGGIALPEKGLVFYGMVSTVTSVTVRAIGNLAGFGDAYFNGWSIHVVRQTLGGGAAPQGEQQLITNYVSLGGIFTSAAFTVPLTVGDEIYVLHPRIASIADIITSASRLSTFRDFWSAQQATVTLTAIAANVALPDVVVAGLPAGATVARVQAIFKFRMVENTNAAVNSLAGAQSIQVRINTPGPWANGITFVNGEYALPAAVAPDTAREAGDVPIGAIDLAATVVGNATYNLQWAQGVAAQNNLNFNDVQVGLRIWYF